MISVDQERALVTFYLLRDNGSSLKPQPVREFFAQKNVQLLDNPVYLPDLAPKTEICVCW